MNKQKPNKRKLSQFRPIILSNAYYNVNMGCHQYSDHLGRFYPLPSVKFENIMRPDPARGLHSIRGLIYWCPLKGSLKELPLDPYCVSLTLDVWKFCPEILFALIVLYDTRSSISVIYQIYFECLPEG